MTVQFQENYLTLRKLYPPLTERVRTYLTVTAPPSLADLHYQELLSEANLNYFHREYAVALQNYQSLRYQIFLQCHPEMPRVPVGWRVIDFAHLAVDPRRLVELSRQVYEKTHPGDPVETKLAPGALVPIAEFPVNEQLKDLNMLGLDASLKSRGAIADMRQEARDLVIAGQVEAATAKYTQAAEAAKQASDLSLSAELLGESAAAQATFAGGADRPQILKQALASFQAAEQLYGQVDDHPAQEAIRANVVNLYRELGDQDRAAQVASTIRENSFVRHQDGQHVIAIKSLINAQPPAPSLATHLATQPAILHASPLELAPLSTSVLPVPQTTTSYLVAQSGGWQSVVATLAGGNLPPATPRTVGLYTTLGVKNLEISAATYQTHLTESLYQPRMRAADLAAIDFYEEIATNFVAYIPHLYFFVLPVAIGDTYLELGQFQQALDEYSSALSYTYLNREIEAPSVWLRMARVYTRWGDLLFRQERAAEARPLYEHIILENASIPVASPLYQPAALSDLRTSAGEVAKEILDQPHNTVNPKVAEIVIYAYQQIQKIAQGLNFLGIAPDYYPIFRFKYLQNVANYLADSAVQAERAFINFRAQAESQQLEHIQLRNAVEVNQIAVQVENERLKDAALEVTAARQTRQYAEHRRDHAQQTLDDWDTKGWELGTVNAALSWAGVAGNHHDITYTGVQYNGQSHDFDTNVTSFFDTLTDWREQLNFDIQRGRLARQRAEMDDEVAIGRTREKQAQVRLVVQQLTVSAAQKRLEGAQQMLDFASERTFNEDLWFRLAAELQDLARQYLDMAIYAAFLMERAYALEFDRDLQRIRMNYGIGGAENLLGGDLLKRDIASFTIDYLENAQQKNPVRTVISLRDEFPSAFAQFIEQGTLPFRTDLEIFDRRFPGSYRRKLKKLEVFVEGLVPLEGIQGTLLHQGVCREWRMVNGTWTKQPRALPAQRLLLSSYETRRDVTVFQPSEEMLGIFENLDLQGSWTLELPRSANNLQYETISDIKLAFYFDADYDDQLAAFLKTYYSNTGGRSLILSVQFHFPDQFFRLTADNQVTFTLLPERFAYNYTNLAISSFGVRLLPRDNSVSMDGKSITVTRASDSSSVTGTTNAQGELLGDATTLAPFGSWRGASPIDAFTVKPGANIDIHMIGDIQLLLGVTFAYRPDGTLSA